MSYDSLPTIKVKANSDIGFLIINESDYDPDKHTRFVERVQRAKPPAPPQIPPTNNLLTKHLGQSLYGVFNDERLLEYAADLEHTEVVRFQKMDEGGRKAFLRRKRDAYYETPPLLPEDTPPQSSGRVPLAQTED